MNRRGFLGAMLAGPVVITTPGLLMPVRQILTPAWPTWVDVEPLHGLLVPTLWSEELRRVAARTTAFISVDGELLRGRFSELGSIRIIRGANGPAT